MTTFSVPQRIQSGGSLKLFSLLMNTNVFASSSSFLLLLWPFLMSLSLFYIIVSKASIRIFISHSTENTSFYLALFHYIQGVPTKKITIIKSRNFHCLLGIFCLFVQFSFFNLEIGTEAKISSSTIIPFLESFVLKLNYFLFIYRWKLLQVGLDEQYKKLNEIRRRGEVPTNQDFLSVAVHYPWARATSQNKVPYYINHQTETTHW